MKLQELEAIDEATNILMDHVVRSNLNIADTVDSELDDEVYSTIHSNIKLTLNQILKKYKPLDHEEHKHFTQFLIAQALMARPSIFESFDYEEIWIAASRLLPEYLKSDLRNQGTDFQMVDMFLDTIPVSTLKSLES